MSAWLFIPSGTFSKSKHLHNRIFKETIWIQSYFFLIIVSPSAIPTKTTKTVRINRALKIIYAI